MSGRFDLAKLPQSKKITPVFSEEIFEMMASVKISHPFLAWEAGFPRSTVSVALRRQIP